MLTSTPLSLNWANMAVPIGLQRFLACLFFLFNCTFSYAQQGSDNTIFITSGVTIVDNQLEESLYTIKKRHSKKSKPSNIVAIKTKRTSSKLEAKKDKAIKAPAPQRHIAENYTNIPSENTFGSSKTSFTAAIHPSSSKKETSIINPTAVVIYYNVIAEKSSFYNKTYTELSSLKQYRIRPPPFFIL